MTITHDDLWAICKELPDDYEPWGNDSRERGDYWGPDCSGGCAWYAELRGKRGLDWGVCTNPASHRCGLLTFEHQGCWQFQHKKGQPHPATAQPAGRGEE